ncbi:MAG: aspartate--tRNA(Asn) ligase [Candidatus Saccharimonadales bacterium]
MTRILSSDVHSHVDQTITIQGWLHKKRLLGGITFINIRDRRGLTQVVVKDKDEVEKLRGLQIGTVLSVSGKVVNEPRSPGGAELHEPKLQVEVPVGDEPPIEIDKPLSHKPEHLETLFDNRPIGLRNLQEQAIFKTKSAVVASIRDYLSKLDFTEIHTPKLLAEATEGGAEVFQLDYFGKTATLAQSAQFYKQMMVGVFERVFEIGSTYRAELSATTRHMSEFLTVDGEIGFVDFEELQNIVGGLLIHVVNDTWQTCQAAYKSWNVAQAKLPAKAEDIPRITISEIHDMFFATTKEDHRSEGDLAPAEEKWICQWASKNKSSDAVFVTGWSATDKTFKFYHKVSSDDAKIAERADLLFRGVELSTLSMRQHDYQQLIKQLKATGGNPDDSGYAAYLSAFKYGLPPHGGFGLGLERLVEKLFNLANIKEAALFPRDINRLTP